MNQSNLIKCNRNRRVNNNNNNDDNRVKKIVSVISSNGIVCLLRDHIDNVLLVIIIIILSNALYTQKYQITETFLFIETALSGNRKGLEEIQVD